MGVPGQNVEFECNVTEGSGAVQWDVNGLTFNPLQLFFGNLPGHTINTDNQRNIIVTNIVENDSRHGSVYRCFLVGPPIVVSDPAFLYVAGKYKILCTT